jgi:hypothetical protein
MQEEQIREALNKHRQASAVGDANTEQDIYDEDPICDYPRSGVSDEELFNQMTEPYPCWAANPVVVDVRIHERLRCALARV